MGDRTIEATGSITFEDLTNNVKAVIIFSTYQKSGFWKKSESGRKDEFIGMIYQCQPILNPAASARQLYSKHAEDLKDLKNIKDMVKPICEIKGSWLHNLVIDRKKYWDIDVDIPYR